MESVNKFADFKNNKEIIDTITKMEQELSQKAGRNVILVAYDSKQTIG
jgi:hypothetical protein